MVSQGPHNKRPAAPGTGGRVTGVARMIEEARARRAAALEAPEPERARRTPGVEAEPVPAVRSPARETAPEPDSRPRRSGTRFLLVPIFGVTFVIAASAAIVPRLSGVTDVEPVLAASPLARYMPGGWNGDVSRTPILPEIEGEVSVAADATTGFGGLPAIGAIAPVSPPESPLAERTPTVDDGSPPRPRTGVMAQTPQIRSELLTVAATVPAGETPWTGVPAVMHLAIPVERTAFGVSRVSYTPPLPRAPGNGPRLLAQTPTRPLLPQGVGKAPVPPGPIMAGPAEAVVAALPFPEWAGDARPVLGEASVPRRQGAEETAEAEIIPDRERLDMRLFVPSRVSADDATAAIDALGAIGLAPRDVARVGFSISEPHIRFYHGADRAAAMAVAEDLDLAVRDFSKVATAAPVGRVELWLSGSGRSAVRRRTAAPAPPQPAAQPRRADPFVVVETITTRLLGGVLDRIFQR